MADLGTQAPAVTARSLAIAPIRVLGPLGVGTNRQYVENLTRSAMVPDMRATVMMANIAWYMAKTYSGIDRVRWQHSGKGHRPDCRFLKEIRPLSMTSLKFPISPPNTSGRRPANIPRLPIGRRRYQLPQKNALTWRARSSDGPYRRRTAQDLGS